jgi:DNA-directed RNA polymerase subunit RPC12/RpoP
MSRHHHRPRSGIPEAAAAGTGGRQIATLVTVPSFSGDVWTVVFLAVVLKLPLLVLVFALWRAFRIRDREVAQADALVSRIALCAYCGSRITVGYDAVALHEQAVAIARGTGEATFDVESRLIQGTLREHHHYVVEPVRCPDCGEQAVWTPIEAIDLGTAAPGRRRVG